MTLFARTARRTTPTPAPAGSGCKSLGLKALFEVLDSGRKHGILDLGSASGSNVEFLSRYASKIRVENLYRTLLAQRFFEQRREEPLQASAFERIVPADGEEHFDVVLVWDLWNYLRQDEIRALVRYLERLAPPGSFLFAISSTLKEMPSSPMAFRILDAETLLYVPESSEMRPCPRYVPRDLALLMPGFRTHSSFLLRNGMQEYLLVRTPEGGSLQK